VHGSVTVVDPLIAILAQRGRKYTGPSSTLPDQPMRAVRELPTAAFPDCTSPIQVSGAAAAALLELRDPCISPLTEVEFASLVARKRRLKELGGREAGEVLRLFGQRVAEGYYRRLPLGTDHFFRARDLIGSMASALSTMDALHLSVVVSAGIPLLTADRDFARAARRHDASATLVK
jgi:predicted nucleic acid-binding protein